MPLPRVWEDAYSLARKQLADGVSVTVVGRVRDIDERRALLEAVCPPSEIAVEVGFVSPPCGVVGEVLVIRGVAQSQDY